jgi:uncharacterized membrane protein YgdD (TMEM256/DUF423 family)
MQGKLWFIMAGLFGATAVGIGAFHAHGLPVTLEQMSLAPEDMERRLGLVETAYRYQMLHAVAVFAVAIFLRSCPSSLLAKLSGFAFVLGIVLFSGSLYGLALTDNRGFARLAPFGGFTLIVAWLLVALTGLLTADPGGTSSREN